MALRRPAFARLENTAAARLAALGEPLTSERARAVLMLAVLILLFTRPLFRGALISGHDSLEYPPRLVEMTQALRDHQFPPLWAPDLGSGHGQPLFEFAAPLIYFAAVTSNAQSFQVFTKKPARLHDSVFYYPGWTMTVDNREVPISPEPVSGIITSDVIPAGPHRQA